MRRSSAWPAWRWTRAARPWFAPPWRSPGCGRSPAPASPWSARGSGPIRGARATTRLGWRPRARRWPPAPTCWSSVGRSPGPPTRPPRPGRSAPRRWPPGAEPRGERRQPPGQRRTAVLRWAARRRGRAGGVRARRRTAARPLRAHLGAARRPLPPVGRGPPVAGRGRGARPRAGGALAWRGRRRGRPGHGRGGDRARGRAGERALIVENVVTTGGSALEVAELLGGSGATVAGLATIVDRLPAGATLPLPYRALARVDAAAWIPEECPVCQAGREAESPGSRGLVDQAK